MSTQRAATFVADAGKGVGAGPVGFAIGSFKDVGDAEVSADAGNFIGDFHDKFLTFDDTRAGDQEEAIFVIGLVLE
jgi:hypothetical protein